MMLVRQDRGYGQQYQPGNIEQGKREWGGVQAASNHDDAEGDVQRRYKIISRSRGQIVERCNDRAVETGIVGLRIADFAGNGEVPDAGDQDGDDDLSGKLIDLARGQMNERQEPQCE